MKVLLISPGKDAHYAKRLGLAFKLPPLGLATVAGLTKPGIDIHFLDEHIEEINYDEKADIVGISIITTVAPRAYRIADEFMKRGVKVVLGGVHPSVVPEEASLHADSVVIGEAEGSWERLIEDYEKTGKIAKFYSNEKRPDITKLVEPRRDLYKKGAYITNNTFQITRGCPFACSFCSVSNFFGRTYRSRPVDQVIKAIRDSKAKFCGFVDDNIVGNKEYSKRFFEELIPLKVKWVGQASTTIANDENLLRLAKKSGCMGLFIGFESVSELSIQEMTKSHNIKMNFEEVVKKLHDNGIIVLGAFVFGLDNDTKDIFPRTLDFVMKAKLDLVQFTPLTPLPGTATHKKLTEEGRIIDENWKHYDIQRVVFKPKNMTAEELQAGCDKIWRDFYSGSNIVKRLLHPNFDFFTNIAYFVPLLIMNKGFAHALGFNTKMKETVAQEDAAIARGGQ